jgi:putative transposase
MLNFVRINFRKKTNKGGIRHMKDFNVKFEESLPSNFIELSLSEIARQGAEQMLKLALEAEIEDFINSYKKEKTGDGLQRIVRNGYHQERSIQTGVGELKVIVPRSRDRAKSAIVKTEFQSSIVPRYLRRSKDIEELIPLLYLKGISSGDFSEVLSKLVGREVSLSSNTVGRLKQEWLSEYGDWNKRDLSTKNYVYWWIDGVYFNVRLEDEKCCVLIIIGVTEEGRKELVAIETGFRESELGWKEILLSLKERGLEAGPKLAIGDGALGFWKALRQIYPETRRQRCWVHRTRNVLDKLPKSLQKEAKTRIHNIYLAPTREEAEKAFNRFIALYEAKYPKAVECLLKTKEETMAFFDFPAEHWRHIRSTNPIESTFSTVRLRTYKTRGCCSKDSLLSMVFKIVQAAQKRWQRLHCHNIIPLVLEGVKYIDGVRHAA